MALRYLVVEDWGYRLAELREAAAEVGRRRGTQIHIDAFTHPREVLALTPRKLATYDAVFVDFDLRGPLLHGEQPTFGMPTADGGEDIVPVSTGIGVMLRLRTWQETPAYREERARVVGHLPARPRTTPLYSIGDLSHVHTKFSAPASHLWFGAEYFYFPPDRGVLVQLLEHIDDESPEATAVRVQAASHTLDILLNTVVAPQSSSQWNRRPGGNGRVVDEMYDWLALYLAADGKAGRLQGFIDAVRERHGLDCTWTNSTHQYAPHAQTMLDAMGTYLRSTSGSALHGWPTEWKLRTDPDDPLLDVLTESEQFWTAPDVRAALREDRRRRA